MSWTEAVWAKNGAKAYTDAAIAAIGSNMTYKGSKATISDLPLSGNKKGDLWTVVADGSEWVWTIDTATGSASDWLQIGNMPSSTASDVGKFMRVNASGAAEWQTVPNANGVSF